MESLKRRVLFLCTGNYYRSRYAEELFNHVAARLELDWEATSRALAIERGRDNIGPISRNTLAALISDGISPAGASRMPLPCTPGDLTAAELVVAVKKAEHRQLIAERFAGWEKRVVYWNVHDIDKADPHETLAALKHHVTRLAEQLGGSSRSAVLKRNILKAYREEKSGGAKERAANRLFQLTDPSSSSDIN